jgi:hypothetical protein
MMAWLLTNLFMVLLVNNSIFQHVHVLDNGKIVRHAHPFNKTDEGTPLNQHKHSTCEFSTLQSLSFFQLVGETVSGVVHYAVSYEFQAPQAVQISNFCHDSLIGRSPPRLV